MSKYLIVIWITFGLTLEYFNYQKIKEYSRVKHLEMLMEECLKGGTWNLQGYYFRCEAVYLGVSDYDIHLGDSK